MDEPISLAGALAEMTALWSPRVVASVNDYEVKVAKVQGEFTGHSHAHTDEFFLVLRGHLRIELPDGAVDLSEGHAFVVPAGVEHRPIATEETHILLFEPRGTVNTGD